MTRLPSTLINLHVKDQGKEIDFSAYFSLPSGGTAPYPAIINIGGGGFMSMLTIGEARCAFSQCKMG
jgi:hypothetical protein